MPATLLAMRTKERTEFGERLFTARTHAKLSQEVLAKRTGMTQNNLSHLELHGQGTPKVAELAMACGVRIAWLAKGDGPMVGAEDPAAASVVLVEEIENFLQPPNNRRDFRTVAFTLAESLEQSGVQLTIRQFLDLAEKMYRRLGDQHK